MKKLVAFASVVALSTSLFAAEGSAIYKSKCLACHGADGSKVIAAMGVKPLNTPEVKKMGESGVSNIVAKGHNKMPAFEGKLSAEEIKEVSEYVVKDIAK
jgi:mono/diheme cytochrome c family protein